MSKINKRRYFIIISVLFLLATGGISLLHQARLKQMSGGTGILDMRLGYSTVQVSTLFDNLGYTGRGSYIVFLFMDFAFIIFFALIQYLLISYMFKRLTQNNKWQNLKFLPYVRGIFDGLENILILLMLFNYPAATQTMAGAANLMTMLKWISMAVIIVVTLGGGIMLTRKSISNRRI